MLATNLYPGNCCGCQNSVKANGGFRDKRNGSWVVYCRACCPQKIEAVGPVVTVRELRADGSVQTPYEPANLPLLRSFPGAKWDADRKVWTVSLAQSDRERVLELADRLKLDVAPELRNVTVTAEAAAAANVEGLYPFQVRGVQFLSSGEKRLLGDDMGCGKTVQALRSLPEHAAAIVVCPACVKYNWADECKRWRPDLRPVVLTGKGSFRPPVAGEIVIINYDILPETFDAAALAGVYLIADEIHKAKNYKAKRSQRLKVLAEACKVTWGLTGTPLLTRPPDLYGVLESLGMANLAFGSFGKFMRLFHAEKGRWGGLVWGSPAPEVPEMLRRVMLRRTREEVLPDLPRKTYSTITINGISASLRRRMDDLAEQWSDAMDATDELPPFEEFSALRAELAASRIDAVTEYVDDCDEQDIPLIVASAHRAPIDALESREGWATITGDTNPERRQDIVRRFQSGELKGIGLTIQAGGVGITLTRAWRMLFVDMDWTPANNAQCEDRICRIGQTSDKVEIVRMVSDHILDQHVQKLIAKKIDMIQASIENVVAATIPETVPTIEAGETDEQFAARMAAVTAERERREAERTERERIAGIERAQGKAAAIREREAKRAEGTERKLLPLTPERTDAVRRAFNAMLDVCDGAVRRDGAGFNKPDAFIAHAILPCGLERDCEVEAAYWMLSRYSRQLNSQFPILFRD